MRFFYAQMREAQIVVKQDTGAGDILRECRGDSGAFYAPVKYQHKQQIKCYVKKCTDGKENQRYHRISDRAQKTGKVVIKERGENAGKYIQQVFLHQRAYTGRHAHKRQNKVHTGIDQDIQKQRDSSNQKKGQKKTVFHTVKIPPAKLHGKKGSASHAETQQDGGKKHH